MFLLNYDCKMGHLGSNYCLLSTTLTYVIHHRILHNNNNYFRLKSVARSISSSRKIMHTGLMSCKMASEMVDDPSVNSLQTKMYEYLIDAESASIKAPVAKIKRVPMYFRERMPGADKYFEPMVLYLGPFHRGKDIPEESKRLKKKVATIFMRATGDSNHCFEMCKKIYDEIDSLMKCYELVAGEEEGSSDRRMEEQQTRRWKEESSWMLFEDGCAILYFICRKDDRFTTSTSDVTVPIDAPGIATEDILKLENQIPYRVLTLLMESAFKDSVEWRSMIDNFITYQILRITTRRAQNLGEVSASRMYNDITVADHLREMMSNSERLVGPQRTSLPPAEDVELEAQQSSPARSHHHVLQAPPSSSLAEPVHLLQYLREKLVGIRPSRVSALSRTPSIFTTYSSELMSEIGSSYNSAATSLKSRNIDFYRVHFKNNLTNISCDLKDRHINIPSIAISASSKSILMNLAADEVSSDIPNSLEISSFLHFLDKLVDSPEDAKVLREAKIIHNFVSNDNEAAAFLNDTAALLPTNAYLFGDVEKKIQYLLENDPDKWRMQLANEYLRSPWAVLAFVGGMLVLSLTMLQTYITIFPVPEELVKNVNQGKVIFHLMKRMFTAVLLPLPILLTLLWILLVIASTLVLLSDMPKKKRQGLAANVGIILILAIHGFGLYAFCLQLK